MSDYLKNRFVGIDKQPAWPLLEYAWQMAMDRDDEAGLILIVKTCADLARQHGLAIVHHCSCGARLSDGGLEGECDACGKARTAQYEAERRAAKERRDAMTPEERAAEDAMYRGVAAGMRKRDVQ